MYLDLELGIPGTVLSLDDVRYRQVPFAMASAINQVAKRGQAAQTSAIFQRFTVRRPGRLKTAVQIYERADKRRLEATLTIRDPFLVQHEEGGTRRPGDVYASLVQPVSGKQRRIGVVHGRSTPAAVLASDRKAFITRTRSGKVGVFRRVGRSRLPIELVFSLEREVKLSPRLRFHSTIESVVAREWEAAFGAALARAIATAR